jgi:predicted metal-binding protein
MLARLSLAWTHASDKNSRRIKKVRMTTTIHICVTCRAGEDRPGARLFAALQDRAEPGFALNPVECLSVCKRPCTIAFSAPGKWTYVHADLAPEDVETILAGARLYDAAPDGVPPWKDRSPAFKKNVVARIPPLPSISLPETR